MTNLDNVLKSRDITLLTKVHIVKAVVFQVVICSCESWTVKKAKHQRIDAFKLWCWRRLLRVPWTGRRSNQSVLKEINSEYSLEELMLKLKCQYFGHLMRRAELLENSWCWERLRAEGEAGIREWDGWMAHWCNGHEPGQTLGDDEGQESLACYSSWGCKESDMIG